MERVFLTNRIIRNYLQLFSENKWKEVIKCTLIYGIQSLQLQYTLTSLSPQKLEELLIHNDLLLATEALSVKNKNHNLPPSNSLRDSNTSKANPLDDESNTNPDWFTHHAAVPRAHAQTLHHNTSTPTEYKTKQYKVKPKTPITDKNMYYGKKSTTNLQRVTESQKNSGKLDQYWQGVGQNSPSCSPSTIHKRRSKWVTLETDVGMDVGMDLGMGVGMDVGMMMPTTPTVHNHTHTHAHNYYTVSTLCNQELPIIPEQGDTDFDSITSRYSVSPQTRLSTFSKQEHANTTYTKQDHANTTYTKQEHANANTTYSSPRDSHHKVGETSSESVVELEGLDLSEDFGRGLDMWKGNTLEIAARLKKVEKERKELHEQLLVGNKVN